MGKKKTLKKRLPFSLEFAKSAGKHMTNTTFITLVSKFRTNVLGRFFGKEGNQ